MMLSKYAFFFVPIKLLLCADFVFFFFTVCLCVCRTEMIDINSLVVFK